jgi:hypothetical protein
VVVKDMENNITVKSNNYAISPFNVLFLKTGWPLRTEEHSGQYLTENNVPGLFSTGFYYRTQTEFANNETYKLRTVN